MIRNLKALGLALAAILAMSVVAASSASAHNLTAPTYPQHLLGEDIGAADTFTVGEDELSCHGETFTATLTGPVTDVEVTPNYETCQTVGSGWNVTVTENGCTYVFKWAEHVETDWDKAHVYIKCPVGQTIEIHHYSSTHNHSTSKSSCTNTVHTQTATGTVNATSITASNDIELHGTATVNVTTHGVCSLGFTITVSSIYHTSATLRATSGERIHIA